MSWLIKLFRHLFIILLLLVLQLNIMPTWPWLRELNVALVVLVFISVVYHFYLGIAYALVLGLLFDLYSVLPFGAIVVGFLFTLFILQEIFKRLLTNKSFYSLLTFTLAALIIFRLLLIGWRALDYFWSSRDFSLVREFILLDLRSWPDYLLINLALATLLFVLAHIFGQRFRAVFIDTTRR